LGYLPLFDGRAGGGCRAGRELSKFMSALNPFPLVASPGMWRINSVAAARRTLLGDALPGGVVSAGALVPRATRVYRITCDRVLF